jgi:hypothetical protein
MHPVSSARRRNSFESDGYRYITGWRQCCTALTDDDLHAACETTLRVQIHMFATGGVVCQESENLQIFRSRVASCDLRR